MLPKLCIKSLAVVIFGLFADGPRIAMGATTAAAMPGAFDQWLAAGVDAAPRTNAITTPFAAVTDASAPATALTPFGGGSSSSVGENGDGSGGIFGTDAAKSPEAFLSSVRAQKPPKGEKGFAALLEERQRLRSFGAAAAASSSLKSGGGGVQASEFGVNSAMNAEASSLAAMAGTTNDGASASSLENSFALSNVPRQNTAPNESVGSGGFGTAAAATLRPSAKQPSVQRELLDRIRAAFQAAEVFSDQIGALRDDLKSIEADLVNGSQT